MADQSNGISMIERVAAAIGRQSWSEWEVLSDQLKDVCREHARAAIEALREPSNEVLEAMWTAMFVGRFTGSELPMLGAGFEAALDAALSHDEVKG